MSRSIKPVRVNHMNVVLRDFDASVAHFQTLFDATFLLDMPGPNFHACLLDIGGYILEIFVPPIFLLSSRHGPHHLGIEYQANVEDVRAVIAEQGIGIVRDIGEALHTDPADSHGIAFEFWHGSFPDNDPPYLTTPCRPAAWWRDEHPLGLTGVGGYTVATPTLEKTARLFETLLGARRLYAEDRPALAAKAIGLQIADDRVELLAPTGDGPLRDDMDVTGRGIRSTIFKVRDLAQARAYFEERGVPLIAGTAPDSIAIDPKANLGLLFEFVAG